MRGKKAKALRRMVGYNVTADRPQLPGSRVWTGKTLRLPKTHPRRAYQFCKRRYGILPLAAVLARLPRA